MAQTLQRPCTHIACAQATETALYPSWLMSWVEPRPRPGTISRHDVLQLLKSDTSPGNNFVLIDLRRSDYEGGSILNSINVPAKGVYRSIPSLYLIFRAAGVSQVIWYCGSSSSRATTAATWFADYLHEQNDQKMQSLVLAQGIKGWVAEGGEYVRYMDGYDDSKWPRASVCTI